MEWWWWCGPSGVGEGEEGVVGLGGSDGEGCGGGVLLLGESSALGAVVFDGCASLLLLLVLLPRMLGDDIKRLLLDRVCACRLHAVTASCRVDG